MKRFKTNFEYMPKCDVYIANSRWKEELSMSKDKRNALRRSVFFGYLGTSADQVLGFCEDFLQVNNISMALLKAHGCDVGDKWYYSDGRHSQPVQNWIDKHEGNYNLLILSVCNPESRNPEVNKSLAVIPSDNVSLDLIVSGTEHRLVIPNEGQIYINRSKFEQNDYAPLKDIRPYISEKERELRRRIGMILMRNLRQRTIESLVETL